MYTVRQLSRMAGISRRTLHYYDEIGLLKPTKVGKNGYRYYDQEAVLRLQQILLYREISMPLNEIRSILSQPDFDLKSALEAHRAALRKQAAHLERIIQTVDNTLRHLEGNKEMNDEQLFDGFSEAQQVEYEKEAMQLYDPEIVKASSRRWKGYSTQEKQRVLEEGRTVYENFAAAVPKGAASAEAQACVEHWRRHMEYFWTPNEEQLVELAEGYSQDERFKANFDKIHPDLALFVAEAVKIYITKKN
jgi:MerR family transcriptional regulator, thiopeptide resistance regulator